LVWSILVVGVYFSSVPGLVRSIVIVPYILFVPGYAVSSAISSLEAPEPEQILLKAIGISLALPIIGGLIMHLLDIPLLGEYWLFLLVWVSVSGIFVARLREFSAHQRYLYYQRARTNLLAVFPRPAPPLQHAGGWDPDANMLAEAGIHSETRPTSWHSYMHDPAAPVQAAAAQGAAGDHMNPHSQNASLLLSLLLGTPDEVWGRTRNSRAKVLLDQLDDLAPTREPAALNLPRFQKPKLQISLLLLSLAIICLTFLVMQDSASQQFSQDFTQLWALPREQEVQLGVRNLESEEMQYRLVITHNAVIIEEWDHIFLKAGETWQEALDLSLLKPDVRGPLEATLYLADAENENPYRRVELWVRAN
jgi:hypothetical protein